MGRGLLYCLENLTRHYTFFTTFDAALAIRFLLHEFRGNQPLPGNPAAFGEPNRFRGTQPLSGKSTAFGETNRLAVVWQPPGSRLATAWQPPGNRLATVWPACLLAFQTVYVMFSAASGSGFAGSGIGVFVREQGVSGNEHSLLS